MPAEVGELLIFNKSKETEDIHMSVVLTLSSLLIGMAVTAAPGVSILGISQMLGKMKENNEKEMEPILTRFSDGNLLIKTLNEHGFHTTVLENNSIVMESSGGKVRFYKEPGNDVYSSLPIELTDAEQICIDLDDLNEEYMANVQTQTYLHLMEGLKKRKDLSLESEQILEDDTILLTLTVN